MLDTGSLGQEGNYVDVRFILDDLQMSMDDIDAQDRREVSVFGGWRWTSGSITLKITPITYSGKGAPTTGRPERVKFQVLENARFGDAVLGQVWCEERNALNFNFVVQKDVKPTVGIYSEVSYFQDIRAT